MAPRVSEEERQPRAVRAAEKHPAAAVVREARAVGPRHCRPLNPRHAAGAKRIGEEPDRAAGKLGEEVHSVLAPEGDGPRRREGEDAPRLAAPAAQVVDMMDAGVDEDAAPARPGVEPPAAVRDRKSTRLNSSHRTTSYAVFCLKKNTTTDQGNHAPKGQLRASLAWLAGFLGREIAEPDPLTRPCLKR